MLQYSLTENLLTDAPDDYTALVQPLGTYDKEAIITEMLRRGTLLTRTDIVAVLNGFEETVRDITRDGGTVNTPFVQHLVFNLGCVRRCDGHFRWQPPQIEREPDQRDGDARYGEPGSDRKNRYRHASTTNFGGKRQRIGQSKRTAHQGRCVGSMGKQHQNCR